MCRVPRASCLNSPQGGAVSPNWLLPQQTTLSDLPGRKPQTCFAPMLNDSKRPSIVGAPPHSTHSASTPSHAYPQHSTPPSGRSPHDSLPEDSTPVNPPTGGVTA